MSRSSGRSAAAPLRIREFRTLWAAQVVSNIGSFLQSVAASWLMLQMTGSPLWVGLMVASNTLPILVLALPAGALADLVDRRRVLFLSQAAMAMSALAMAVMTFQGAVTPTRLLVLGLLLGSGLAVSMPAWQALVPDLVPRDLVPGAVSLNSAAFNVARAVGPAIGGIVVATAGPGWAFALNAVSYLGILMALGSLRGRALRDDRNDSIIDAIGLGIRYARFTPAFRWLLAVASAFALTSAVLQAVLPNLTDQVLGGDAGDYGLLLGSMGAGALVGALTRQRVDERLGAAMVPLGIVTFGVAGILVGLAPAIPVAAVAMALAGTAWVWTLATLNSTVQLLAPPWVRGRLMSLYNLAFVGFLPLGAILAGVIGSVAGVRVSVLSLSAGAVALGAVASRLPLPVLGQVVPPEPPEDYEAVAHPVSVAGGRVVVLTTWVIADEDLEDYLAVMDDLRRVRLRTGAYRWRLYRNVEDARRMTEAFTLRSWDQHLAQHRRLDREAAAILLRARSFDRADGPVTHHLAAVDVVDPAKRPDWDALVAQHEELHAIDGSVPLANHPRAP